jgi:hypothetical protein
MNEKKGNDGEMMLISAAMIIGHSLVLQVEQPQRHWWTGPLNALEHLQLEAVLIEISCVEV